MKATIIQLWALLCLVVQVFFEFFTEIAKGAFLLLKECGIDLTRENVFLGFLYFACAYLFVISVWLVLM